MKIKFAALLVVAIVITPNLATQVFFSLAIVCLLASAYSQNGGRF